MKQARALCFTLDVAVPHLLNRLSSLQLLYLFLPLLTLADHPTFPRLPSVEPLSAQSPDDFLLLYSLDRLNVVTLLSSSSIPSTSLSTSVVLSTRTKESITT